ncbi:hypothetical protein AB0K57_22375 [Streptomyces halstedii]|uniref:hypothetical protein n=1 Tax=Streptomyces halstedii TaxID=1944 RepID=UPI00345F7940
MSPTATLCWRPPLRTMAYTRISLSLGTDPLMPAARAGRGLRQSGRMSGLPRGRITGRDVLRGRRTQTRRGARLRGRGTGVKPGRGVWGGGGPRPRAGRPGTDITSRSRTSRRFALPSGSELFNESSRALPPYPFSRPTPITSAKDQIQPRRG